MATKLGNLERPAERDLVCLQNFMHGGSNRGQIVSEELWMYSESDLVTLFPPRNVALATTFQWLVNFFGFMSLEFPCRLLPTCFAVTDAQ